MRVYTPDMEDLLRMANLSPLTLAIGAQVVLGTIIFLFIRPRRRRR